MKIKGIADLTRQEIDAAVADGARFVFYEYCISLILVTFRQPSPIYFLRPSSRGVARGLPYVGVSLLLGWWGLPWGVLYTVTAIFANLRGGRDVTSQIQEWLKDTPD